ncbi:MAG: response regulator [Candidatus Margulisbacteria bacterium]|nr:response regulator [Candidatus Margulisiibacteriota bacterium]
MTKQILVVDDDETFVSYLSDRLASLEFAILRSESGKSAFEICLKEHPDIIISDMCMPDVDGCDLAKLVKTNTKTKDILFIMISEFDNFVSIAKALDYGADAYFGKPCDFNALLKKLRE